MPSINWKIRLKNKNFWIGLFGALALFLQTILSLLGLPLDLGPAQELLNTLFSVLAAYGVLIDPTTPGASDAVQIMKANRSGDADEVPDRETIKKILKGGRP